MRKKIQRRSYNNENAAEFSSVHPLLQRIYLNRQIYSSVELQSSLDYLLPFSLLKDIDKAVLLLSQAIFENHTIMIIGDFDADGATSTAVAIKALKSFGAKNLHFLVPNRFAYGYGLTPELVEVAKSYFPQLIVTVDNGIANHAGVLAAKKLDIKVLITDHHLPSATLPEADAIVNPNQPEDNFPSKNLAGVGVVFYVMLALRQYLIAKDWFSHKNLEKPNMGRLLDLVALGTVADLVKLDHNNRILVHQGLQRIKAGICSPGIIALLELANRDFHHITAADLGFAVGARLNAAGRMDDMSLGIECLISDDPTQARTIAKVLNQLNEERKGVEQDMQAQALFLLQKITGNFLQNLPKGLCLYDPSWHQGVIGILASRIKDKFNRPVIVFAPGQQGELKGSARSIPGLHIRDLLALIYAKNPELISKFGGHAMAAGLTIPSVAFNDFVQVFEKLTNELITDEQLDHCLLSDGELDHEDFNLNTALMLREAGPWGQSFPEPLFDGIFQILEQRIVGDKHLKLKLGYADKILDGISFFIDIKDWPNHRCEKVHIAYRLDVNEYKGRQQIQLIVDYLEPIKISDSLN